MNKINNLSISEEFAFEADESSAILKELEKFINQEEHLPKLNTVNEDRQPRKNKNFVSNLFSLNNRTFSISYLVFLGISVLLFALIRLEIFPQEIGGIWLALLVGYIAFCAIKIIQILNDEIQKFGKIKKQAIFKAKRKNIEYYYKKIEDLGNTFYKEHLHCVELKIKIFIHEENKVSNENTKYFRLYSILLVVTAIWVFEISIEAGTSFLGIVTGVSAIVTFVIDAFNEYSYRETIDVYEKCVLILQEAQKIAPSEEIDAIQAYDEAIASDDEAIPFEQAIAEIEQNR